MALLGGHDISECIGSDGFEYSADYLDTFGWDGLQHPFAGKILGKEQKWDALGFFTWLYEHFPSVCLEARRGHSQMSRYFPGNLKGEAFLQALSEIDMPVDEAIEQLRVLEDYGVLWVVHRGQEVLHLELRPS